MSLLQNIVIKNRNITEGISRALHFIYIMDLRMQILIGS